MSVQSIFRQLRSTDGSRANYCLASARIMATFDDLSADGFVRIRKQYDDDYQLDFDCGHVKRGACDRCTLAEAHRIEVYGVWGLIGEFRAEPCDRHISVDDCDCQGWEQADSCWGFIGEAPRRNYPDPLMVDAVDIMAETMQAFSHARLRLVA